MLVADNGALRCSLASDSAGSQSWEDAACERRPRGSIVSFLISRKEDRPPVASRVKRRGYVVRRHCPRATGQSVSSNGRHSKFTAPRIRLWASTRPKYSLCRGANSIHFASARRAATDLTPAIARTAILVASRSRWINISVCRGGCSVDGVDRRGLALGSGDLRSTASPPPPPPPKKKKKPPPTQKKKKKKKQYSKR